MKYGYSTLLRELVQATEVEVGDCERFQISCPACRQAVFKKTRTNPQSQVTHFLSHYRAETADEKECDLRVDAIGEGVFTHFNIEARGQTLDRFMAVLKQSVILNSEELYTAGYLRAMVKRLDGSPVAEPWFHYAEQALSALHRMPNVTGMVASMTMNFPSLAGFSPFWHRRQASYVADIIRQLQLPQFRSSMRVVALVAFMNIAQNVEHYTSGEAKSRTEGYYDAAPVGQCIKALVSGKSIAAMRKTICISANIRTDDQTGYYAALKNLAIGVPAELIGPIVGALARIPFPELVANANAKLITSEDQASKSEMTKILDALLSLHSDDFGTETA